jgi:hypothetical protein
MKKFKGRGVVQITGRQTGKSILNNMFSGQALQRLMDDILSQPITNLILSEGTVYGSRYYCIEPVGGNWREMEDWCIQNCGETTGSVWAEEVNKTTPHPGERWYANNRKFWFRNEKDRTMFILKWR